MSTESSRHYDDYWRARDLERTRRRSLGRAALALRLLGHPGGTDESGPQSLLEVGCGPGWCLEAFTRAGYSCRGLDVSPVAVEMARERGLGADVFDLEGDELADRFHVVVALEVLEHLRDPLAALEKLKAAVGPGGRLVVSLPNEFHLLRRLEVLAGRPSFGGHADPHLRFFHERSARRLFRAAGLRVLARLSDSLVPPRWAALRGVLAPMLWLAPGLFALAHVFLLQPES